MENDLEGIRNLVESDIRRNRANLSEWMAEYIWDYVLSVVKDKVLSVDGVEDILVEDAAEKVADEIVCAIEMDIYRALE